MLTTNMLRSVVILLCAVAVGACGNAPATGHGVATTASRATAGARTARSADPALELAHRTSLGIGLESFANRIAQTTVTFAALAKQQGIINAQTAVSAEVAKALPAYQAQWQQNLAAIYRRHFTQSELRSLASQGPRSPYSNKFLAAGAAISQEMKQQSGALLQKLVAQALINAQAHQH